MLKDILKSAIRNFQALLVTWVLIIIVNQIFIFGACFAPYCIMAALPHTFVVAVLLNYFLNPGGLNNTKRPADSKKTDEMKYAKVEDGLEDGEFEETVIPFCPTCGAKMVLRTAKTGPYVGNKFWGCSKYPNCKGLLNL
ncbi:topoisomerase DNA-binding C4 zinc finger domain-containing protein [Halomonas sp. BN3-1]|uniref:topoisomerase DNA-binding C4 zinc finger domain-containing protein n=1 Tax=Halomonas sp. BN3-1 TaxID=2082393 RepID=UPI000D36D821|nr:topoisomerase DNA-binding C4 zinc finger domain-containing protein [Halomonas sp. BN3-1]